MTKLNQDQLAAVRKMLTPDDRKDMTDLGSLKTIEAVLLGARDKPEIVERAVKKASERIKEYAWLLVEARDAFGLNKNRGRKPKRIVESKSENPKAPKNNPEIIERLKVLRWKSGFTVAETSKMMGYSTPMGYQKIESNVAKISLKHIAKLSEIFSVSEQFLLWGKENGEQKDQAKANELHQKIENLELKLRIAELEKELNAKPQQP